MTNNNPQKKTEELNSKEQYSRKALFSIKIIKHKYPSQSQLNNGIIPNINSIRHKPLICVINEGRVYNSISYKPKIEYLHLIHPFNLFSVNSDGWEGLL